MAKLHGLAREDQALDAFYEKIEPHGLRALWRVIGDFVTPEPNSPAKPASWEYQPVRDLLMEAGGLISAEEAERRVLILENPGMLGSSLITRTLYAGMQLILPGEVAPCHRHTQNALRFVVEGEGAHTALNGEKIVMRPFDLVLTPNMLWHDHGNETDKPMVWMDGLDLGLVKSLDAAFADRLEGGGAHVAGRPSGDSWSRYGVNMRPFQDTTGAVADRQHGLLHYPYDVWRSAIEALSHGVEVDAHYGWCSEFVNPVTGGAVMETLSAFAQKLPKGMTSLPLQSSDSSVHFVVDGTGQATIGEHTLSLNPMTTFVVPPWAKRQIEAFDDLVLFSFSDKTVMDKLGLWREHRHPK